MSKENLCTEGKLIQGEISDKAAIIQARSDVFLGQIPDVLT